MIRYGGANKYHSRKTERGGVVFDSRREADRWQELILLQRAGRIAGLNRQVRFELIPAQGREWKGDTAERACFYIADFTYIEDGKLVVEDVKSKATRTPEYRIKKKLMRWVHGIRIREVE